MQEINIDISVLHPEWPDISDIVENVKEALAEHLVFQKFKGPVEISLVLADDQFIQGLNRDYRDKDKPTNVLSFPQDPEPDSAMINLGDVIMAHETIIKESKTQKKSFAEHVTHLVVHGILHLLEYDHETDEEAKEMETLEIRILERLDIKNPYEDIVD